MPITGSQVTASASYAIDGVPTDPAAVTLTVRAPDGTQTTPTPSNPDVGVYEWTQTLTEPGVWWFRWDAPPFEVVECCEKATPAAVTV